LGRAPAKERCGVTLPQAHAVELRPSGRFGAALGLLDASQSGFTQQVGRQTASQHTHWTLIETRTLWFF